MRAVRIALAMSLMVLGLSACDKGSPTAPAGAKLTLTAAPATIPANGTSTIRVRVTRASGLPVNAGTQVQLTTTIGFIDPLVTTDENGFATATLRGNGQTGTAKITATSGGATDATLDIVIGQRAAGLTLQAQPTSIDPLVANRVRIFALVRDDRGDPIEGALVVFTTEAGRLDSRGLGVRTDADGRAVDVLNVSAGEASGVGDGAITVSAQVSHGGGSATAQVNITFRDDGF